MYSLLISYTLITMLANNANIVVKVVLSTIFDINGINVRAEQKSVSVTMGL